MIEVGWRPRAIPLAPAAVAVHGSAARRLARQLMAEGRLAGLDGVAGPDLLVLLGEALPWIDGCVYLGRDARCPLLLLPTAQEPTVGPDLLERAVLRRTLGANPPVAVIPRAGEGVHLAAVGGARQVDGASLFEWLEARA